jgi:hypothetical protein
VVVAAAVVVALIVFWPRHHSPSRPRFATLPKTSSLDAGGTELVRLLQHEAGLTVHAMYHGSGGTTVEIWQSPPRVREDTVQTVGGHSAQTTSLTDGQTGRVCYRQDTAPLTCNIVGSAQLQAVGLDGILGAIVDMLGGEVVVASDATVDGVKSRCFSVSSSPATSTAPSASSLAAPSTATAGTTQLCVASDGLPVSISRPGTSVDLVNRSSSVDPSAFVPPKS